MNAEPIAIGYLDGRRLARAFIAGAQFVADRAEPLNRINVFPVPDGDTGTNLATTVSRIASALARSCDRDVRAASRALADEAVAGARGNSGVILAQFFCGFSEALPDRPRATTADFGRAVTRGASAAYEAIARPQEGTILTVLREWARHVAERAVHVADFARLLPESLTVAHRSLAETPKKLPLLGRSGVVDAGAQGFVYLLEGMIKYLRDAARRSVPEPPPPAPAPVMTRAPEQILFRYCTEVLIEGCENRETLRRQVALLGDSIVLAGSARRVRLHVHTNEPERVFELAGQAGLVAETKAEDMRSQHEARADANRALRIGLVTDSSCDLPESLIEDYGLQVVPLRVFFGSENYLDKVTIRPSEFYGRFAVTDVAPKTSQPPPADFRQVYESLAAHHGSIVVVTLAAALSGTHQSAKIAARGLPDTDVRVVDSRSAAVAQGLIVREAAEAIAAGRNVEEVVRAAEEASRRVRFFVAVPTLEHLVRGGRVAPLRGFLARVLGLLPVLTIDAEGKARPVAKVRGFLKAVDRMVEAAFGAAAGSAHPRFGVTHADSEAAALDLGRRLRERYPDSDVILVEAAPVLGAHAGPGALGIAILP